MVRFALTRETLPSTWTEWANLTERSVEELHQELKEATGMSFLCWRRQVRFLRGVCEIAAGRSVAEAARGAGYASTGHWVTSFRQIMGTTPGNYFKPVSQGAKLSHAPPRTTQGTAQSTTRKAAHRAIPDKSARESTSAIPLNRSLAIRASTVYFASGHHNAVHHHNAGELFWPEEVVSVGTHFGTFVGSNKVAIWIPVGCEHESQFWGVCHSYLVDREQTVGFPKEPCALIVAPTLASVLRHLLPTRAAAPPESSIAEAFFRETRGARPVSVAPLPIPLFSAALTLPLVRKLRANPGIGWTQEEWAKELGVSRSTLQRLCQSELGCTFGRLQTLMQVRRAVELLTLGQSVESAAHQVGYVNTSQFIARFKRIVGMTPGRYCRALRSS